MDLTTQRIDEHGDDCDCEACDDRRALTSDEPDWRYEEWE